MGEINLSNYRSDLISFANSEQLASVGNNNLGAAFNSFDLAFKDAYEVDEEDEAEMKKISEEVLTNLKNKAEISRFIPKPEEFELYYGSQAPDLSTAKNAEDKIAIIDKWKEDGLKKSSDLIPSQTDDFKTHLDYLSNSFIREAVSDDNKTGWLGDKVYRAVEGAMSMVTPFIPGADRFLAENLPENTGMDDDISSMLFAGAGQLVSQAAIALGTSAVAGPGAGVAAIGTIYSARALVEGYKEEMRKSGNPDKALDVGLAGIPGAQLETFADSYLLGLFGGYGGKIAFEAFQKATTRAAKEAIIKAAIPSIGKKALQAGLAEASVGAAGADFTTGYGRYLASGDESYIPTAEQLAKGALVEGLLGAGYTTAFNRPTTEMSNVAKDLKTFSQDKANADDIFKALKSKNYDLAVELATKDYANQPEKKTEASKIISDGLKAPSDEAKEKATSPILPNHRLVLKTKLKEFEKAGDTESAKRISDTLKSVNDGSFTAPESFGLEAVAPGFELTNAPVSIDDGNVITLKDGTEVQSDETVFYVKGISNSAAITQNIANGGLGIRLDSKSGKASFVFPNKTKSGDFTWSQSPPPPSQLTGYTAVKANAVHQNNNGNRIVSNFSILGEVASAKKSEAAKQKTQTVVAQAGNENSPQEVKDAASFIQEVNGVEGKLNEDSFNKFKERQLSIANSLFPYFNSNDKFSLDIWNEFSKASVKLEGLSPWAAKYSPSGKRRFDIQYFASKAQAEAHQKENGGDIQGLESSGWAVVKEITEPSPVKPVRENQDIFQKKIEDQRVQDIKNSQPKPILQGVPDGFQKSKSDPSDDDWSNLIKAKEDLSFEIDSNKRKILTDRIESLKDSIKLRVSKPNPQNIEVGQAEIESAAALEGQSFEEESVSKTPTVESVVATPEAVFVSVSNNVTIEHTVEDEVAPAVATLESLKEDLVKEQASLASVKSEKFKNTINKKIATIEKEIALLESSGAKDIPTAVQQIKEEIVEQKKTEPVKTKEKPDIKPGQLAAVDIESTNKKDADGNHLFTAKGKSYSVKNNKAKGWHLSSGENFIFLGKTKEEAKVKLASELNNDPNFGSEYVTSEKSNTEILKAVTFTPPKPESVDEKIARLNKAADDAANKVISDKVDAHIATIENETAKKKWSEKRDAIRDYINFLLNNPSEAKNPTRPDQFSKSIGNSFMLSYAETEAGNFDEKIKAGIQQAKIKSDKVAKELIESEAKGRRNDAVLKEEQDKQLALDNKPNKIRYSISSSTPETSISQEEAQEYIDANGFNVNIEDTQEVTEDGHQWNGRVDFRSGTPVITVNIANISSVEQLRNVINEELGHVAYNVPQIAEILGKIKDTTKLRDEIKDLYKQSDLYEESVVKRMADLVDSYSEKGMFDKLVTAIKSYVKDKLGMELSDADLSYIAYRAINKASKVTKANKNIESKFSKEGETDSDGYTETPDIFSVLTNNITTEQRETFKKIQKMLRKKLEKKLIVDEPAAWSLLKSIKFGFLKQESLKAYNYLLDEFVRTRSKNRDPKSDVRDSAETVIAKASELAKEANQGHFDFLQMKHEFLEDKDFTNDYQGDIDLVMQLAKDDRGHKDSDLPSDKDGETLQTWQIRTLELQDLIFDNLDYVNDRLEEMFPSSNISTSNPILSKYLKVFQNNVDEVIAKQKEIFKSRMNQLMSDPTDKSYRDLRKQYFGLMDFLSDGYALNIEDFITQETADALATKLEDKDIMDMHKAPWRKKWLAGASSFYANTRMLGSKVADITSKLTNNFRSGIMAAERIHNEFTKPVLKEMYESAVAENGGKDFNGQEHNHAGIYSMARAFKATEGVTEGILNSKRSIETSIRKDIKSVWSGRKKAAKDHLEFLNNLFIGITKDTPNEEALGILEANAEKILPKGLISYVKGINELFEATKPLAKFTSEFGLGRPFEEWVNYTPSLAITKEGQPIEFDVTEMSVNVSSDESVHGDTNMQRGGGGSMKDRTRRLGNSMVYVFNINHLAENRMRLNLIDYLTLQQRRELNNVISGNGTRHKEFAKLLKDEDGGKERVSHLQTTVRTMWSNTIQSASFISEFQAGVNVFSNMWASGKLASLYQFPGQVASNLAPYFVVNSGSPKRIKYLFDAMGILLKKQMGQTLEPRLDKVVSRILSTVHGRSQEQFLDKSIALDVNGSAVWQQVKTSSFWNQIKGINRLREKILFSQFIYSDMMTGAPMMLANMMAHEEAAGRATSWDGLTFNDESFIKAVDEAERFVGIGASSRRGVWTNNKNGYLVTLRNMLSAFSSHRVNNATNFAIELAKVNDSNTTSEEKAQSVRYMLGIQAQSVVFSVIKWGMVGAFYNLLTASMGDEENEDELEKKYRKLLTDKNISKEQKLTIQAEISMLQKIRNEYEKVKDKNNSYEVLVVRGLQDMVSNSFLIPAATDIPVNALIHNTYDKWEAMRFNEVKESELKQLNEKLKKAKDSKNISAAIELQKDISRWESQEAITFVYEGQSIIPFDGVYGGVMKDAAKFVDSASSALLKAEPLSMADVFLGTGLVGLSQPELNKIARLYAKKEEYEQEYKEKIEDIKKIPAKDRK